MRGKVTIETTSITYNFKIYAMDKICLLLQLAQECVLFVCLFVCCCLLLLKNQHISKLSLHPLPPPPATPRRTRIIALGVTQQQKKKLFAVLSLPTQHPVPTTITTTRPPPPSSSLALLTLVPVKIQCAGHMPRRPRASVVAGWPRVCTSLLTARGYQLNFGSQHD